MKAISVIFILIYSNILTAQVTQEWVETYQTGTGYNFPKKNAIDNSGNFIVAGTSYGSNYDFVVLKYSSSGNQIWERRYNGIGDGSDYVHNMILDDSGNIYITGVSWAGASNGKYNWVTIKYRPNGDTAWLRSFNWTANESDEPFGITLDKDNNVIINGYGKTSSLYMQFITVKYNMNGDKIWTRTYLSTPVRYDMGWSIVADDSNNVYSSGYGQIPTGNEIVTIKYNSEGDEKWIKKFPTYYGDYLRPTFSAIDNSLNLVVVGYNYTETSDYDFVTLKYSPNGELLWSRSFAEANNDFANSLLLDDKNNILIGGSSYSLSFADYLILKYSTNGDTLIIKMFDGGGLLFDQIYSIATDKNYNIYLTGYSERTSGLSNFLTMKLNSLGEAIWSIQYITPYNNYAYCLILDKIENAYVTGECSLPEGNSGIVTVKYSQLTGVTLEETINIYNYKLNNYPNPFNPVTNITYELPGFKKVLVKIYNVLGIEIKKLVNDYQSSGKYSVKFNGSDFSSGIYFYSLYIDNKIKETRKMLLIR